MQPAKRPSCSSANPLFRVQVPLDRLPDLVQGLGHSQPGRVEWSTLVVVENPAHRRAIVEHHTASRIGPGQARSPPPSPSRWLSGSTCARLCDATAFCRWQHGLFDLPQAAHLLSASEPWHGCRPPGPAWPRRGGNGCRSSGAARPGIPPRSPSRTHPACPTSKGPPACPRTRPTPWPWDQPSDLVGRREINASANQTRFWVSSRTT